MLSRPQSTLSLFASIAALTTVSLTTISIAGHDQKHDRASQREGSSHDRDERGHHSHDGGHHGEDRDSHPGGMEARMAAAMGQLADQLEAGNITQQEAIKRLRGMQRRMEQAAGHARIAHHLHERLEHAHADLRRAVESGEITEAQARVRLDRLRQRLEQEMHEAGNDHVHDQRGNQDQAEVLYKQVEAQLKVEVEAGHITRAQAAERLEQLKKRLAHMHQDRGEHRDRHEGDHTHDVDWDAVSARLKEAVERGAMTQAQADQVMADMKRRLEDGHEH